MTYFHEFTNVHIEANDILNHFGLFVDDRMSLLKKILYTLQDNKLSKERNEGD